MSHTVFSYRSRFVPGPAPPLTSANPHSSRACSCHPDSKHRLSTPLERWTDRFRRSRERINKIHSKMLSCRAAHSSHFDWGCGFWAAYRWGARKRAWHRRVSQPKPRRGKEASCPPLPQYLRSERGKYPPKPRLKAIFPANWVMTVIDRTSLLHQ